ncbi:MAG: ISL3 family transposase [Anaerolineales bacterium]|nr:ISL3 family transposase [Anaerolineales bacterium]
MSLIELLLAQDLFELDNWELENNILYLTVSTKQEQMNCPNCHTISTRVHSRYDRTITDLPWADYEVRICLEVKRFFCGETSCCKKTFAEQVPSFVNPYGRRSIRLNQKQTALAFSVGGTWGSLIATLLKIPISGSTLLRLIRKTAELTFDTPKILGVDDWALCKGLKYGTILVDLERNKPIDLLLDRTPEVLETWLREHPGVEVIARDRSKAYATGASNGAPEAVQVADRWHLLKNYREALYRWFDSHRQDLKVTRERETVIVDEGMSPTVESKVIETLPPKPLTKAEETKKEGHEARQEQYRQIHELHQQGLSKREIASRMGVCFRTVQRYLATAECPLYAHRQKRPSKLQPFLVYLEKRWQEGCHDATKLWQEINEQGFKGSASLVRRWAVPKRQKPRQRKGSPNSISKTKLPKPKLAPAWSAQKTSWVFVKPPNDLTEKEDEILQRLLNHKPIFQSVYELTQQFVTMIRGQQLEVLDSWMRAAKNSTVNRLADFAKGLEQDLAAVKASLIYKWSTSPVEGQINRLKLIKRTMYGRAKFDLLKKRVLGHGAFT